jgi:hypothetical protein
MLQASEIEKLINDYPKIKEALAILYAEIARIETNKDKAGKLLAQILGISPDRPKGWQDGSSATYYKPKYGKWVLEEIISKIEGKGKNLDYEISARDFRVSRKTLKMLAVQGWLWLIEHSEPEVGAKYRQLRDELEISLSSNGIVLRWKDSHVVDLGAKVELQEIQHDRNARVKWKSELDDFIANAKDNDKLVCENLDLRADQIEYIKELVQQCPGIFIKNLKTTKIELIKNLVVWNKVHGKENI